MVITVAYDHDSANLEFIYLASIPAGRAPNADEWKPALRDIYRGKRVVWARFNDLTSGPTPNVVWLRDGSNARTVIPITVA